MLQVCLQTISCWFSLRGLERCTPVPNDNLTFNQCVGRLDNTFELDAGYQRFESPGRGKCSVKYFCYAYIFLIFFFSDNVRFWEGWAISKNKFSTKKIRKLLVQKKFLNGNQIRNILSSLKNTCFNLHVRTSKTWANLHVCTSSETTVRIRRAVPIAPTTSYGMTGSSVHAFFYQLKNHWSSFCVFT